MVAHRHHERVTFVDSPGLTSAIKDRQATRMPVIRILVVAEIRFYREGLADTLARTPRLSVVGAVSSAAAAIQSAAELDPDIVIIDSATPNSSIAVTTLVQLDPRRQVVVMAVGETADEVLPWAESGVAGYVPRHASLDELIATIERAVGGQVHCSSTVAAGLFRRLAMLSALVSGRVPGSASVGGVPVLTQREREIVVLLERGLSNKAIAGSLGIELATAKNHVHRILEKLNVHRRSEAAALLRRGLLDGQRHEPPATVAEPGADRPGFRHGPDPQLNR